MLTKVKWQLNNWATSWENFFFPSAQSDQRLCYSLLRSYYTSNFYIQNFKPLAGVWNLSSPVWVSPGRKSRTGFLVMWLAYVYSCIVNNWAASGQNQQNECAPSEDSDQPVHPPSLIRVFAVRMKKAWILSYPLSAQDAQADLSLRWAHSHIVLSCHGPYTVYVGVVRILAELVHTFWLEFWSIELWWTPDCSLWSLRKLRN